MNRRGTGLIRGKSPGEISIRVIEGAGALLRAECEAIRGGDRRPINACVLPLATFGERRFVQVELCRVTAAHASIRHQRRAASRGARRSVATGGIAAPHRPTALSGIAHSHGYLAAFTRGAAG